MSVQSHDEVQQKYVCPINSSEQLRHMRGSVRAKNMFGVQLRDFSQESLTFTVLKLDESGSVALRFGVSFLLNILMLIFMKYYINVSLTSFNVRNFSCNSVTLRTTNAQTKLEKINQI